MREGLGVVPREQLAEPEAPGGWAATYDLTAQAGQGGWSVLATLESPCSGSRQVGMCKRGSEPVPHRRLSQPTDAAVFPSHRESWGVAGRRGPGPLGGVMSLRTPSSSDLGGPVSADSIGLDGCTWEKVLAEVPGDLPGVLGRVPGERQSQSSQDAEGPRPPWRGGEGSAGRPRGGRNPPSQPSHVQN